MNHFKIGDRVFCPEHPYLGQMTIVKVYQTSKKTEFIAQGNTGPFVQGSAKLFALVQPKIKQLSFL